MTIVRRAASQLRAVLPVLMLAALLSACSSSGGKDTVGPNASGQSSSAPATSAPVSSANAGGTAPDAATASAIRKAYGTFFSGTAAPAASQKALQHGEAFAKTLEAQSKQSYSQHTTVKVLSIKVNGKVADVVFSLFSKGAPLLQNIQGKAVQDGSDWKVAAMTFCALLKLQGALPPACNDTSITSLPQ